jgi:hypothetical protein
MKKEFEYFTGYKLEVHNRDTCWGQYYADDDWSETYVYETPEECIDAFWNAYAISNIEIDGLYFFEVEYIVHQNKKIIISSKDICGRSDLEKMFYNSSLRKDAIHNRQQRLEEEKRKENEERVRSQEEYQRAQFEKLKEKYGK